MAKTIPSTAWPLGQPDANLATLHWLERQSEFRSDDASIVRAFVAQLLRDGTLSITQPVAGVQNFPAYVAPALTAIGLAESAAEAVWNQFSRDTNLKSSPSGRCRSEVRRKASFLLWLKAHFGKQPEDGFALDPARTSAARVM
ncbi:MULTISPECIES: hypothetical protein [Achromobacter]|uniref:Uncharacterized protein n=1 Tax=Achromobacter xylosoxidans (strain A8) TaxID=762376 RepID=E3HYD9_ACHXA|nr:hypothetical protein [Achromobacter xylosoxidans]ADP20093.1 hypothetical protein AXYL_06811 [Achromobacter xylosoxidans A8]